MKTRENPWWHAMHPSDVLKRAEGLPGAEQQALISEIKAACASMQLRCEDKSLSDDERYAAKRALTWTAQKKNLLAALATRSNERRFDEKRERVETLIEAAEQVEDPKQAVLLLAAAARAMWNMEP